MSESTASAAESADEKRDKDFRIIVNGEPKSVESEIVSFEQVTKLAYPEPPFPETMFTVTYRNAKKPKEGRLVEGQSVEVKRNGTVFNVKATDKS
jgi:multiubiquitin